MNWWVIITLVIAVVQLTCGCQFYPQGEYLRFVRVPENLKVGEEVLKIEVHPKNSLYLQPVDKEEDVQYFTYRDVNRTTVSLLLAKSLEELVDNSTPRNVLKFKISCDYHDGEDTITSSLSITVYVEDVNDHSPTFLGAPYFVAVDELFPVGLTLFRGIRAIDRDKPNTPNSDVQYAIVAGNERGKFALESSQEAMVVLKKAMDYDAGDREFLLTITASDRGLPPRATNATLKIKVNDNDDLPPKFTKGVYRTKINEFYPVTGVRIHERLRFDPPIYAFDQDFAIDTPIRYDIIAGNERHLFYLDHVNGSLFLEREIDLDAERALPGNTFVLQIQASQVDNPLKTGVARVEVEVMDLNDNLPEFEVDFYNISIVENLPNGFSVLQIIAADQDQGDNAEFSYQLDDKSGAFTLDSRTGWMTVRDQNVLDRERRSTITMRVFAKEKMPSVVTHRRGASFVNIEVTLLDANDNNPTFIPSNLYDFAISKDARRGDLVGTIHAMDPDLGRNGLVSYAIQKAPNNSKSFTIETKRGQIFVADGNLTAGKHLLFVEASDQPLNPSERRTSLAVVSIDVKDQVKIGNIDVPEFIGAPYEFWVGANVGIGTSVGQIRVTSVSDKNKVVFDLLHSYHDGVPFAVEEKSGVITVVDELQKFSRNNYDFEGVVTYDRDYTLVTNVTLHVVDPNDEKTILMKTGTTPLEFHVKENQPNVLIGKLGFKNNYTSSLKFSIANQKDVTDVIAITTDGTLHTLRSLDRESRDIYRLTIIAEYNRRNVLGTGIYQVIIYVDDENDNKPTFERNTYEGKIRENCRSGTEVDLNFPVHVSDKDIGTNGQFTVTIFGEGSEFFRLDRTSGRVMFTSADTPLDREKTSMYNLRLVAKDKGGLYSEAKLTIQIEDENDNAPSFTEIQVYVEKGIEVLESDKGGNRVGHFEEVLNGTTRGKYVLTQAYLRAKRAKSKMSPILSVPEDIGVGIPILQLIATDSDADLNAVVKYEMISETYIPHERASEPFHLIQYFMIHSNTGEIGVARTVPPESEFRLNISASDNGNLKDFILIRLIVRDVNDHPPVFKKSWYNFDAEEATYSRTILGKIEAMDADFGANANITYSISTDDKNLPFSISPFSGTLMVEGPLDRETQDKFAFIVVAKDNPLNKKSLSSSVNVEVNVLDVNDNAPEFYGYDDTIRNDGDNSVDGRNYQSKIPVYYAAVSENSPIGTPITKIFANDTDFTGNGNGLILFDIPYKKNEQNLFSIDSKEGVVTTIGKLDYETQRIHNVTVIASDLGSPSLSSTAMLTVNVIDVPEEIKTIERPVFAHRYYEVEVEENVPVPLKILTLNVTETYKSHKLRYSIVADKNPDIKRIFRIDPRNGTLFIIQSPDREQKALYELVIRLDQYKVGRDMTVMVYPVTNERLGNLGLNEVKVIVRITDMNDNSPKFTVNGRPIVAALPTTASYGYEILKLEATDPDLGLNGEVRYQILSRPDEANRRFSIDPVTGQVRAIATFTRDAGKVFGFDVKATDRRGADDGKSSIANVFVYVIDEQKQLIMVMSLKPTEVEKNMNNITQTLYNVTGFDIRVRKLEPHNEKNLVENDATDMYLYAVDPLLNTVVDMDELHRVLERKQDQIEQKLEGPKVLSFSNGKTDRQFRSPRIVLSAMEISVVVLGCAVFLGALTTAICVMCIKKKKKTLLQKTFSQPLAYPISAGVLGKAGLIPSSFGDRRSYADIHDLAHSPTGYPSHSPAGYPHSLTSYHHRHHHDANCPRVVGRRAYRERSKSYGGMEKSITSLHSSGQDSGIVDATMHCRCGLSSSRSSDDSSNSYEDSLQSIPRSGNRKIRDPTPSVHHHMSYMQDPALTSMQQRRSRNRSITEDIVEAGGLQRIQSMSHIPAGPSTIFVPGPSALRRSTERLMMTTCQLNQ